MTEVHKLLTIVFETSAKLDRESEVYRRLISARLKYEPFFDLQITSENLTTSALRNIVDALETKYVLFVRDTHKIPTNYVATMIDYLRSRTVYMAEPHMYTAGIPKDVTITKVEQAYFYARDADIYGVAFNTGRLRDAMDAVGDVDRSALYISFRLYWSIGTVKPLPVGYSVATNTKAAIGNLLDPATTRLFPMVSTNSIEVRTYMVRYLAIYLRGLRGVKKTAVSTTHLRDLIKSFKLDKLVSLVQPLQPFEASWISWLAGSDKSTFLYKQLTAADFYLQFSDAANPVAGDVDLYDIEFSDMNVAINKAYLPHEQRDSYANPAVYDFYSRPMSPSSLMIFFDRPMQADDNAEYLYEYFTSHHPEYTHAYFALNPKSTDWPRLEAKGFNLIPIFTRDFYEKFLESDLVVSSQIYNLRYKGKSLENSRFVYLQHGIQLNDMSDWIISKYFDVFVATGKLEADYLEKYAPVETLNSGLPRLESLEKTTQEGQHLLFMPTWRFNLNQVSNEHFTSTEYFRAIDGLITDRRVLAYLDKHDVTLHVKLHPNVESRASLFHFSQRVVKSDDSYREAISSADFVFTDYSSAVLDASFIGIPIAYYQWDSKDFFQDQPYESRLDYRSEGLGPVFDTSDSLIEYMTGEKYLDDSSEYAQRNERFFEGVDPKRINAKIVDRMLSL
ncbi:hypothetical protein CQ017_16145 [Arthrobacter sp. MYb224]|uniref:CDP-glycerol glycerophosphotransferase family protein n=1 Tax=Arthrobacter sp. MYb224 TaxID=1848600 RepID=UPI000CFAB723|nr:CDP-glycerol glycerophosphotransferase family protein [Arthrobacter sp. MYb224]PQZ96718.1 hypothetical protein CQ017_16145 [Arthrobacter sp. MYb224]